MKLARCSFLFIALLFPAFSSSAQKTLDAAADVVAEAEKVKQQRLTALADQIIGDISNFRLGSNRAYLYAISGRYLCKADPSRASELFRASIGELLNAQMLAETERKTHQPNELLTSQTTRPRVLKAIAICDAEFALQSLYKTRPSAVVRAMSGSSTKATKITNSNSRDDQSTAQNESALEQAIMLLAADQNPERAIAVLKESLKRDPTGEALGLLQKLNSKDPDEAAKLAVTIVDKIVQKGFVTGGRPNSQAISAALRFLMEFTRVKGPTEKPLKLDDLQMRSLADKFILACLDQANDARYFDPRSLIPLAEKLSPGNVSRLKTKFSSMGLQAGQRDPGITTLLGSNPTAETLIAEAKNYPLESRRELYSTAANKLADSGNIAGATALLNENFSEDALVNAQESLNWYYAHRLMMQGKYEEAERMMAEFPETNRYASLINLAIVMFTKDKVANKGQATAVLNRVQMEMPQRPANQNEMSQIMKLVGAYATIDPPQAFGRIEALQSQINELTEASILVMSFQGYQTQSQQGEIPIGLGLPFGFYPDASILRLLTEADFDRTCKLLEGFSRPEARVSLKLQLAEAIVNQRPPVVRPPAPALERLPTNH